MGVFRHAIMFSLVSATALGAASFNDAWAQDRITFQQVLRNPSDPALNISYAQQRIEAGDLLAAAATLERLLINEPNWDEARLLYAGVLYQLGDFTAAKREADLLEGRDFSDSALAEVQQYRDAAEKKANPTRVSGRLSAGIGYDENAGAQVAEDGGLDVVDQFSAILRGQIKVEHDLSKSSELRMFAEGDAYYKRFEDDDFDGFLIANARLGVAGENRLVDWRANLSARSVSIGGNSYLEELGVQGRVMHDFSPKTRTVLNFGWHEQEYSNVFDAGDNSEFRDGDRFDVAASLLHTFSPQVRSAIGVQYRDKNVDDSDVEDLFAYTFVGVTGGIDLFSPKGHYLDTTVIFRDYTYEGDRADNFWYGRAAFGVPLGTIFGGDKNSFADPFVFETAVTYTSRATNVDAFDFESVGGEARLIYRF